MLKKVAAVLVCPVTLFVGWFSTKMSEKYEEALHYMDFDDEEIPDPLKVLTPVEPWHVYATQTVYRQTHL